MSTCVRSADPDVLFALDAISRLKQIHLIHVFWMLLFQSLFDVLSNDMYSINVIGYVHKFKKLFHLSLEH